MNRLQNLHSRFKHINLQEHWSERKIITPHSAMHKTNIILSRKAKTFALLAVAIMISIVNVYTSRWMYPIPGGDSAGQLVPAINWRSGHGLTNQLFALTDEFDRSGQHRFMQYPPLFHFVVGTMMISTSSVDAFTAVAILDGLCLIIYAWLICSRKISGCILDENRGFIVALLSITAMATWLSNYYTGRPEALAQLLVLTATGLSIILPETYRLPTLAILLGLLGGTHPAGTVLFGMMIATYEAFTAKNGLVWFTRVALIAISAIAISLICLSGNGYPIKESVLGILAHATHLSKESSVAKSSSELLHYYLFRNDASFYGLYLMFFLGVMAYSLFYMHEKPQKAIIISLAAFTCMLVYLFAIHTPKRNYNILLFIPALTVTLFKLLLQPALQSDWVKRLLRGCLQVLFALMSLGFARQLIMFPSYCFRGVHYTEARRNFAGIHPHNHQGIRVSGSLWVLTDNFNEITIGNTLEKTDVPSVLILQQNYYTELTPPIIPSLHVAEDNYLRETSTFLGLKIGSTIPGYAFAVYEREPQD